MSSTGLRVQIASYNANLQGAEATRQDLTPWLIPEAEQNPIRPVSSPPVTKADKLRADTYRSINAKTPSTHPSLPREAPDFYAVGFQELVPLHTGFTASGDSCFYNVNLDIRKTLRPYQAVVSGTGMYLGVDEGGGPEGYPLLCKVDLVGIALFVYARERPTFSINKPTTSPLRGAASRVKEIRTAKVGFGLGGVMGNKGAVGARIVLASVDAEGPDEVLTFVSAHLSAHDHNLLRRNWEWQQIVQRMVFEPTSVAPLPIVQAPAKPLNPSNMESIKGQHRQIVETEGKKARPLDKNGYTIYDTTHLFVFGDLNYRIALGEEGLATIKSGSEKAAMSSPSVLTKEDLYSALETGDWSTLAARDQLSHQRLASPPKAFQGLTELPLADSAIPPTYKYAVMRDGKKSKKNAGITSAALEGQTLSKKRIPSWTDRVLWASAPGKDQGDRQGVEVELFRSIMHYTHSDHKPITTLLQLPRPEAKQTQWLSSETPYPTLSAWQRQALAWIGFALDRLIGYSWSALLIAGGGSLAAGFVEIIVIAFITAWWLAQPHTST